MSLLSAKRTSDAGSGVAFFTGLHPFTTPQCVVPTLRAPHNLQGCSHGRSGIDDVTGECRAGLWRAHLGCRGGTGFGRKMTAEVLMVDLSRPFDNGTGSSDASRRS